MIYKFKPFSVTKELGKEYNAHCTLVPDIQDWILITDYDTMVLCLDTWKVIEKAIELNPQVDIFSVYTNRIGYREQRYGETREPDPGTDLRIHIERAMLLAKEYCNGEIKPITTAGGFFLLFRKIYWHEVGGFQEGIRGANGRLFDYNFCTLAMERKTIAIIKGAYVWHTYRLMEKDYRSNSHLK